jgi:hypothetical protein
MTLSVRNLSEFTGYHPHVEIAIWFFCKQILPSSHCSSGMFVSLEMVRFSLPLAPRLQGMIGAINAPAKGNNTFAAFQANAEAFKGTPNVSILTA